jgi:gluconokinase
MSTGPPGEIVIGLDAGTTGVKAAAFGLGSAWRTVAIREYPLLHRRPGEEVQDPAGILAASTEALAECVASARGAEVVAVSVSAGMHGLMALDRELRPITNLVTWADGRAAEEAWSLRRSTDAGELHRETGVPIHPMTPLAKLIWFARNDPTTWAAARWWVGLKDWLLLWLTGGLATELSSASGSGLLDMSTRAWSPRALALCGLDEGRLPEVLPTTATLSLAASTARAVGLPAGTPVVAGAADGPLANLGAGAIARGTAGLSLGTSGAVRVAVEQPRVDAAGTLFCYALTESTWVVGGAISNGGIALRWAGRALAPDLEGASPAEEPDTALLELAESVPAGSEGLVMLPYLLPERAPLWNPDLPGAYVGLRIEHTRAHLLRAAVEGVCVGIRSIVDRLERAVEVSAIHATGGVFRSALWRGVMAAMLGRPIRIVADAEGTALGAAALALLALGRERSLGQAAAALSAGDGPSARIEEPDAEQVKTYDALRHSTQRLVAALSSD